MFVSLRVATVEKVNATLEGSKHMAKLRCPGFFCGSKDIQVINKKGSNFSVGKGVLGALLVGHDLGILAGIECAKHTFRCNKCGKKWIG